MKKTSALYYYIGQQIKKSREKLDWSQETLAGFTDMSRATIVAWEQGKTSPSIDDLFLLACLFKCKVEDLFPTYPYSKRLWEYMEDQFLEFLARNDGYESK